MFRQMLRKKQALSLEECIEVLKTQTRGVLSVMGENGYPYGMPMNHYYNEQDGCIYFHCGKVGHRLDALKENNKVSFCVYDQGFRRENEWAWNVKSVIAFGRMDVLDDLPLIRDICEKLSLRFTIAGSSLQDHPTYKVFRDAAALLNDMGWDVEVVCDTQALTKINTGSLEVWAAAWSSALDPDLYQVYHKDSTATSTLAWGYNYLKNSGTAEETKILNDLSKLIDDARSTNDQSARAALYEDAMGLILDLAVELPVYQRSVLYAYNSKVITNMPAEADINPYSSPLDKIWEIEFAS